MKRRLTRLGLATLACWLATLLLAPHYYTNRDQLSLWEILLAVVLLNATSFTTVVLLLTRFDRNDDEDEP